MNIKVFKGKDPKILNRLEQQIYKKKIKQIHYYLYTKKHKPRIYSQKLKEMSFVMNIDCVY